MADEIKQSGFVGRVLPLNPTRDSGARKRRQPREPEKKKPEKDRRDDGPRHIDEYV